MFFRNIKQELNRKAPEEENKKVDAKQREHNLKRLNELIDKIYGDLDPGKDLNKDVLKKLEQIEYKLEYLLEAREYVTADPD